MTRTWSVQEAKATFSELPREAGKKPQIITRHGRVVGVVDDDWLERDRTPVDWRPPFEYEE